MIPGMKRDGQLLNTGTFRFEGNEELVLVGKSAGSLWAYLCFFLALGIRTRARGLYLGRRFLRRRNLDRYVAKKSITHDYGFCGS